ncbi:unnamed protein product [Rotaria sp. Silwood2]|nr:unnamed protein product [Rotaria sp. Silwood2]
MAQNRRAEVRRRRRRSIRIQCPRYVDEQTISSTDSSNYFLSDIGEEATFDYQGTSITISVQSLIETQKLGYGDFGIVKLAEVKEYPDIKTAVKVREIVLLSKLS